MKTDYAGHDVRYRKLRQQGAPGWDTDYSERYIELAWAFESIAGPGRVLDLGCGAGNIAAWLVERGFTVTGIDISPAAIAWAKSRAIWNASFMVGDVVAEIPGTYDVVIDGHCLHCIIGSDRARLLANIRAALAPNGILFVSTMCGEVTGAKLKECFDVATRCQVVDGTAYRYIGDSAEILDELRTAGFEIVRWMIDPRDDAEDQDNLWAIAHAGRSTRRA